MTRIAITARGKFGPDELDRLARQMLATGVCHEDDHVIDKAVKIARDEGLAVEFLLPSGVVISADVAYRLRYERGLDIR
jgi:Ni2+-binding GTPase involved in maturation of urease and hydrogenase